MVKKIVIYILLLTVFLFSFWIIRANRLYNESIDVAQIYSDAIYYVENINLKYIDDEEWNEQVEDTINSVYSGNIDTMNNEIDKLEKMYDKSLKEENKKKEENPIRYYTRETISDISRGFIDGTISIVNSTLYIINPAHWDNIVNNVVTFCKDPLDSISYAFNNFKTVVSEEGLLYTISYVIPNFFASKLISDNLSNINKVMVEEAYYIVPGNKYSGLKANVKYSPNINQYYTTDSLGRIKTVSAKDIKLDPDNERNNYAQSSLNKKEGDDAGHLIGHQFGGSGDMDNLVSMNRSVNRGNYKEIENQLKKAIENDNTVNLYVDISYKDYSNIPYKFDINYSIDNINSEIVIYNF